MLQLVIFINTYAYTYTYTYTRPYTYTYILTITNEKWITILKCIAPVLLKYKSITIFILCHNILAIERLPYNLLSYK